MIDEKLLKENKEKHLAFVFIYLIIIVISYYYIKTNNILEIEIPKDSSQVFYRWLWCVMFGFIGFSIYIFRKVFEWMPKGKVSNESPWPSYYYYYPFLVVIISTLTFSYVSLISGVGYIFYYMSAAISASIPILFIDLINYLPSLILLYINKKLKDLLS